MKNLSVSREELIFCNGRKARWLLQELLPPSCPKLAKLPAKEKKSSAFASTEWEGQTQVSANDFMEKFSLYFEKKWMFPARKNKKGLSWPCRLWKLIGVHRSATMKLIKCTWLFCKYNGTAMSQSTYLSCNYTVFSTHSSPISSQKGIYIHCLSFIGHVLCKAFKKDLF